MPLLSVCLYVFLQQGWFPLEFELLALQNTKPPLDFIRMWSGRKTCHSILEVGARCAAPLGCIGFWIKPMRVLHTGREIVGRDQWFPLFTDDSAGLDSKIRRHQGGLTRLRATLSFPRKILLPLRWVTLSQTQSPKNSLPNFVYQELLSCLCRRRTHVQSIPFGIRSRMS